MVSLVCGLNTYLGRASVTFLGSTEFEVIGLVRDLSLLKRNFYGDQNADIREFDLFRNSKSLDSLSLPPVDFAFYFTQIPDISDPIGLSYELISLRNYIALLKHHKINRVVYIGKAYDKKYIPHVKQLLDEEGVCYTIVLKDVAVGFATHFDKFMKQILQHKYIFMYKPNKEMFFAPIVLKDLFRWIRSVDWISNYHYKTIEFGGDKIYEVEELMNAYLHKNKPRNDYKFVPIPNKFIVAGLNKLFYKLDYHIYLDYIKDMYSREGVDNSSWNRDLKFEYSSILNAL